MAFGGTRDVAIQIIPGEDPYCTAGNLGVGLFTFGDPLDELPVGVLAIGGGCASSSTHVVNGTTFSAFTHGLVVLNDDAALEGFRTAPNITRILEHEVGHGIGLGHTRPGPGQHHVSGVLPAGHAGAAGDRAGRPRRARVHLSRPQCTFTIGPPTSLFTPASGGSQTMGVTASAPSCRWEVTSNEPWVIPIDGADRQGSGTFMYRVEPNLANPAERTATLTVGQATATAVQGGDVDLNGDGIYEDWASHYRPDHDAAD